MRLAPERGVKGRGSLPGKAALLSTGFPPKSLAFRAPGPRPGREVNRIALFVSWSHTSRPAARTRTNPRRSRPRRASSSSGTPRAAPRTIPARRTSASRRDTCVTCADASRRRERSCRLLPVSQTRLRTTGARQRDFTPDSGSPKGCFRTEFPPRTRYSVYSPVDRSRIALK